VLVAPPRALEPPELEPPAVLVPEPPPFVAPPGVLVPCESVLEPHPTTTNDALKQAHLETRYHLSTLHARRVASHENPNCTHFFVVFR
jgi:hypothetical protein